MKFSVKPGAVQVPGEKAIPPGDMISDTENRLIARKHIKTGNGDVVKIRPENLPDVKIPDVFPD